MTEHHDSSAESCVSPEVMDRRRKGLSDYEKPPLGQPPSWLQEQEKKPAPHAQSSAATEDDALWALVSTLHSNVPEDQRPMSWSDFSPEQVERLRLAAKAFLGKYTDSRTAPLVKPSAADSPEVRSSSPRGTVEPQQLTVTAGSVEQEIYEALTVAADIVCELKCPSVWKTGEKQPHSDECRKARSARSAWIDYCSTQDLVASGGLEPQGELDWKAEAIRRFGPIPPGAGENARLIAGYHYAFVEGAKSALSLSRPPLLRDEGDKA